MSAFTRTIDLGRTCTGFFQLTDLSSAKPVPGTGRVVWIQAEAQDIRVRFDGGDPTPTSGMLIPASETLKINTESGDLTQIRVIETAPSAKANIHTFK